MKHLKANSTVAKGFTEEEWLKAIAIRPKTILTSNSKLSKDRIYNVTIPAQRTLINNYGVVNMCQSAGLCKSFCYASMGGYVFTNSMVKHARNLDFLMNDPYEFANQLVAEIFKLKNPRAIRIHDSGDFTPTTWIIFKSVMERCPHVKFYAYTKMVRMFEELKANNQIPSNFTCVYSFGGVDDAMIDKSKHRHAVVFGSREQLRRAGYTEAYNTDIPATNPKTRKVGLVVHGIHNYVKSIKGKMETIAEKHAA